VLLTTSGVTDFFAALLIILSIQVMLRLDPRAGWIWIALCTLALALLFLGPYGLEAIALALVYMAGNILVGSYALATLRAQEAHSQNQALALQRQQANDQLQIYAARLEGLAVARERARLARELHDSVTQTVFSMSLTTHSARLLLDLDLGQVGEQLRRLDQLAQGALSEMHCLITELHPAPVEGGLVSALRQYLASRGFQENLSVTFDVERDGALGSAEEQGLLRIIQEALHNTVKHAQTSQASIRLHLEEPCWVEVVDQGQGFDLHSALASGGMGLSSMRERAAEIGWNLQIITSPGAGTCIRVEKTPGRGRLA
jgi:signal transduction histidine kinase